LSINARSGWYQISAKTEDSQLRKSGVGKINL
jgi:hypothetical protein